MSRIRQIGIVFFAKLLGMMGIMVGLLLGIVYSFGGLLIDVLVTVGWLSPEKAETPGLGTGTVLAFGALIGMPAIGGIAGFIAGSIGAILFNLFSKYFGGIESGFKSSEI